MAPLLPPLPSLPHPEALIFREPPLQLSFTAAWLPYVLHHTQGAAQSLEKVNFLQAESVCSAQVRADVDFL